MPELDNPRLAAFTIHHLAWTALHHLLPAPLLRELAIATLAAAVPEVALDEGHPPGRQGLLEVGQPATHQVVQDDHLPDVLLEQLVDQGGADGPRTSGDEDGRSGQGRGAHEADPAGWSWWVPLIDPRSSRSTTC